MIEATRTVNTRHALPATCLGAFGLACVIAFGLSAFVASTADAGDPEVILRGDGTYENAIAWQYEGSAAPDYGAFAVRFPEATALTISGLVLDMTVTPPALAPGDAHMTNTACAALAFPEPGGQPHSYAGSSSSEVAVTGETATGRAANGEAATCVGATGEAATGSPLVDIYVWDEAETGLPGAVIHVTTSAPLEISSTWPEFSRTVLTIDPPVRCQALSGDAAWAGYWGSWVGGPAGAFVGVDHDGFGPAGLTRIVPGLGFPEDWQDISTAWPSVTALGIGVLAEPCALEPVLPSTWGSIKRVFQSQALRNGNASSGGASDGPRFE
ncbi:MAG: hypothetical protein R3E97_00215 [Candidatus Eisenbacteria bacterium]